MTAPKTVAEIYAKQDWWQRRYDRAHDRMGIAERTLAQAGEHLGIVPMVNQIRNALAPAFPNQTLNVLGPFGLGHTTSIHAYHLGADDRRAPTTLGALTFRPTSVDVGDIRPDRLVMVDYSTDLGTFAPGSLGHYNGLQYAEVEVPEMPELVALLWRQIKAALELSA